MTFVGIFVLSMRSMPPPDPNAMAPLTTEPLPNSAVPPLIATPLAVPPERMTSSPPL